eukprot:snap_masked-scaffold_2-processed-gene-23.35-mRNA-1 protein AED:0.03 eAED:0.03 QI:0/-1/0/1/-1/1/1/0/295
MVNALFAIGGYMTCSALMLLVNKLSVHYLPAPSFVLLCQLLASALFTKLVSFLGYIPPVSFNLATAQKFYIVPFAFTGTIFANIKILEHANVETFIVFRASTPLIISILDYYFLGRHLPDRRSWMCLIFLLVGAMSYVYYDKFFSVTAYTWVLVWYVVFVFDQVYIKHVITKVEMSTWERVYYTNLIALLPLGISFMVNGEVYKLNSGDINSVSLFFLTVSCIIGTGISYFAFLAREALSAAYFTVVGNTCKVLTIILNHLYWDKHATPQGLMSLGVCLVAAAMYKQAPKRKILP